MVLDEIVKQIRVKHLTAVTGTKVVAIDGGGGSGKSTLARLISPYLGDAPIVPTDDFASWDDPLGWAPRFLEQVLLPLSRNQAIAYQRNDWRTGQLAGWVNVPPGRHLIIEGVSSMRLAFVPFITFAIWVETPRDERLRRGLERDGEQMAEAWTRWMSEEDEYIRRESPEQRADLVVEGDAPLQ